MAVTEIVALRSPGFNHGRSLLFDFMRTLHGLYHASRVHVVKSQESSEKDRKLHISMYGKAAQLEKQMETKSAWFQEKYSGRTHGALKEMLEEEAMNKKAQEEKIKQEQAENDAFFLEFELGYIVIASLAVLLTGLGGLEFSEFVHDPQHVCPRYQLPLSAILRSHSRQLRENPAIRRSGALCPRCLHEECQSLLPDGPRGLRWEERSLGVGMSRALPVLGKLESD
ncbi:hypothetical protein Tco_1533771 [Tanacetum coccineum]